MRLIKLGLFGSFALALACPALANEPIRLQLKDHKFAPAVIRVRANVPTEISLTNHDSTAEEFDSTALKVEKVVSGNSSGVVRLRPLAPGRYPFMGEYHSDTAQGVVIAE
ncbi:MAG TPA: cupredoxin domain-containing protein [Rhizomicrobium sp.]|nr:cupredoxin domain-containing protein [Rhizomicrobium sp.]